jgi:3-hydroxyacyl-CoA dehydrogenase
MRLDAMIKQIDEYVEKRQGYGTMEDDELAQVSKWLKELKRLREKVRRCELVHGTVFEELEKKGVIA